MKIEITIGKTATTAEVNSSDDFKAAIYSFVKTYATRQLQQLVLKLGKMEHIYSKIACISYITENYDNEEDAWQCWHINKKDHLFSTTHFYFISDTDHQEIMMAGSTLDKDSHFCHLKIYTLWDARNRGITTAETTFDVLFDNLMGIGTTCESVNWQKHTGVAAVCKSEYNSEISF